jgi:hypothetical protein
MVELTGVTKETDLLWRKIPNNYVLNLPSKRWNTSIYFLKCLLTSFKRLVWKKGYVRKGVFITEKHCFKQVIKVTNINSDKSFS